MKVCPYKKVNKRLTKAKKTTVKGKGKLGNLIEGPRVNLGAGAGDSRLL